MPWAQIAQMGFGGAAQALADSQAVKEQRRQIKQYNANLSKAQGGARNLAVAEGVNQQAAYNWASDMIRKNKSNPNALGAVTESTNRTLMDSSNRAMQLRATAEDLETKKMAVPSKYNWKDALVSFGVGAIGSGASVGSAVEKTTANGINNKELDLHAIIEALKK